MKKKQYMDKILKRVSGKAQILCEDCGRIIMISHVIVDHQDDSIKVVCDICFKDKYLDGLCGKD